MSLPRWPAGALEPDFPVLVALGSREQLYETFGRESDPQTKRTLLRALIALEVGQRRSGGASATLATLLESCAADSWEADAVREAAAIGLPFVSMARAQAALPGLLDSSPAVRSRAIDLLEAVTFLENAFADANSAELRAILTSLVRARIADPATSSEDRKRGEALLIHPTRIRFLRRASGVPSAQEDSPGNLDTSASSSSLLS